MISSIMKEFPRATKLACEQSLLHFTRFFFKEREGAEFIVNKHHLLITQTLKKVIDGEITRLIINIPPGYTKTELAVLNFIAYGLAIEPRARFLHLSYSDALALHNSSTTKRILLTQDYQKMWPRKLREDAQSKKMWYTEENGGLYATAAGGQVTGFRAGRMQSGFKGCLIIDDPIKPADAKSALKRDLINDDYNNTVKSRLALETTPVVVIMQRIHDEDLSGYLLRGGSGEMWHHLMLPVLIDKNEKYPKQYTHGIPLDIPFEDGPLWEIKHNAKQIKVLETSHRHTYTSQYKQDPQPIGDCIFHERFWKYYKREPLPSFDYMVMYGDTAQKIQKAHDYSVFQLWGFKEGCLYLVDQIRGKWEAPDLERKLLSFITKWYTPHATFNRIRYIKVEDKSSGTGLIQGIARKSPIPILGIIPVGDKTSRALDAVPFIESGRVFLPEDADFLLEFIEEHRKFSSDDSHSFDDQVDPTMYAIQDNLQEMIMVGTW